MRTKYVSIHDMVHCALHNSFAYKCNVVFDTIFQVLTVLNAYISRTCEGLAQWCRVMHICVSKIISIGSDNGMSPGRRQAIIWTNDWILSIGPLGTNFSEIWIEVHTFSFKKMLLKMSSGKCRQWCPGLSVLMHTKLRISGSSLTLGEWHS